MFFWLPLVSHTFLFPTPLDFHPLEGWSWLQAPSSQPDNTRLSFVVVYGEKNGFYSQVKNCIIFHFIFKRNSLRKFFSSCLWLIHIVAKSEMGDGGARRCSLDFDLSVIFLFYLNLSSLFVARASARFSSDLLISESAREMKMTMNFSFVFTLPRRKSECWRCHEAHCNEKQKESTSLKSQLHRYEKRKRNGNNLRKFHALLKLYRVT